MNYFIQDFNIEINKGESETKQRIPIRIEASSETLDRDNDIILKSAYDKDTIDDFLGVGIIDYDHKSILGKSEEEKAKAIIGEPTKFAMEKSRKSDLEVPVIYGDLYKENPFVTDSILPALKAESTRWGASIGGSIIKAENKSDGDKKFREISKIKLNHCAITPTSKAINKFTSVSMIKSEFGNFMDFIKAMIAGAETNIANINGGQSIQPQSLEGNTRILFPIIINVIRGFKKAKQQGKSNNIDDLIMMAIKDIPESEQISFIKALNENKREIYNLI